MYDSVNKIINVGRMESLGVTIKFPYLFDYENHLFFTFAAHIRIAQSHEGFY